MLGAINGGLGMKLANNTTKGEIAYGVVADVMLFLYLGVNLIGNRWSRKGGSGNGSSPDNLTEKVAIDGHGA